MRFTEESVAVLAVSFWLDRRRRLKSPSPSPDLFLAEEFEYIQTDSACRVFLGGVHFDPTSGSETDSGDRKEVAN